MLRNERCEIQKTEKEKEAEVLVPADFEAQVECSEWFVNHTFKKKKKNMLCFLKPRWRFVWLSVCLSVRPGRVLLILLCLIDRAHRPIGIAASKQYHLFRPELWSNERAFSLLSAYDSHSGGGEAAGQLKDLHQIRRVTKSPRCPGHVASLFCFSV